jgi:3-methyladenine DNA glycosylase AlkD
MSASPGSRLATALREGLAAVADPAKAPEMKRYMKSSMPYFGVQAPAQRRVFAAVFAAHPLPDRTAWEDAVRTIWRAAGHREERYGAVALTGHRLYRAHQDPETVSLYEELIVDGAWWDFVDELAIRRLGPILRAHPEPMAAAMRAWSRDPNLWKHRSAIICQVGSGAATDTELLAECIDATIDDRDFFIRKGIGWALRQHGKRDPTWVRAFVAARGDRLSGLSRREALKYAAVPAPTPAPAPAAPA